MLAPPSVSPASVLTQYLPTILVLTQCNLSSGVLKSEWNGHDGLDDDMVGGVDVNPLSLTWS